MQTLLTQLQSFFLLRYLKFCGTLGKGNDDIKTTFILKKYSYLKEQFPLKSAGGLMGV